MANIRKIIVEWDNDDRRTFEAKDKTQPCPDSQVKACRTMLTQYVNEQGEELPGKTVSHKDARSGADFATTGAKK